MNETITYCITYLALKLTGLIFECILLPIVGIDFIPSIGSSPSSPLETASAIESR